MSEPFIGFGNETLGKCPPLKEGEFIDCPRCGGQHVVEAAKGEPGKILPPPPGGPTTLLFYHCGKDTVLAGLNGRSIVGRKPDVKGEIPDAPPKGSTVNALLDLVTAIVQYAGAQIPDPVSGQIDDSALADALAAEFGTTDEAVEAIENIREALRRARGRRRRG